MIDACAAAGAETPLVEGLLGSVDCNISNLVAMGYGALAGPDSPLLALLTAALTLYVAVLGLRLLLGLGSLRVGDLTVAAVKIGVVLALASNWPLYHRLVFETLFHGPEQLAGQLLTGSAAARPADAVHGGLQFAFDEMQASAAYFAQKTPGGASPWLGGAGFSAAALNLSSVLMLVSTVGVLLGLKIVLAALLVTGPLFLGFLLFQSTRGVFAGWLRAALGLALAPLFAQLALVLELRLLQPHLADIAAVRAQGGTGTEAAVAILVVAMIGAIVTFVGLLACGAMGLSLRLPGGGKAGSPAASPASAQQAAPAAGGAPARVLAALPEAPPRVAAVAAAAAALERRDSRTLIEHAAPAGRGGLRATTAHTAPGAAGGAGGGHRRSAQPSAAASSLRRDG